MFALAAVARPERFFDRLRALGLDVTGVRAFRDHHRFSRADINALIAQARAADATALVTTEKDAVRLEPFGPLALELFVVPLRVDVQPADGFAAWLAHELDRFR